ncbi:MAG: hypothetical protein ACLPN1_07780 [Dissulfurispiraceae bacterium]|jgi:hypothetical protein
MEKICAQCGEVKSDCMVTVSDAITCERQILCSGCRAAQSGDIKIISSALDLFIKATNTKTAGGGLNGYKFMLELVAGQMAEDHGYDAAIKRLQLVIEEIVRAKK